MCTNQRWITNPYTHQRLYVKCGHCKACIQEKAFSAANRIRNEFSDDKIVLFVGLTYDRDSCPYILESDLHDRVDTLPVYRAYRLQRKFDQVNHRWYRKRVYSQSKLFEVRDPNYYYIGKMRSLAYRWNRYGVIYYNDYQRFLNNLRHILKRKYGIYEKFKIWNCSEYGSRTKRPHFHFLLYITPSLYPQYRDAICKAWPFADIARQMRVNEAKRRPIQIAKGDTSKYVASYVNCGSDFPPFLAYNFKPKHSASKLFGHGNACFSLAEILSKVPSGDMFYTRQGSRDGVPVFLNLPIPKYILNKWFPIFKGYTRLTNCEVSNYIYDSSLLRLRSMVQKETGDTYSKLCDIGYTDDDLTKIDVRLHNAYERYHHTTGRDRFQYARDFVAVWSAWKSWNFKNFRTDSEIQEKELYDNLCDFQYKASVGLVHPDDVHLKMPILDAPCEPNAFACNVSKTLRSAAAYDMYYKEKDITNAIREINQVSAHKMCGLV